ncbi:hypothetical protein FOZ60_014428 [Perkinsus olseni]|uniref:Methyltransferase type 11 domain-containing protein n=1 Tax=Perkinsus olseni TaxID=32597 RepID=A0A7J6P9A5_PEROL|nr:hypothetical protein FOZ60_014428 [Perkinsus olseni]
MQSTCPEVADFSKISHYPEGANKEFQDKDKDQLLEFFLPKFEVERPLAHHLDGLFEVFGLTPEAVTVEVGPGTGLLTRTEEDLCLPAETDGSVDLAVLCDVYHHLTYPKTIIQQLRKALKDTGRLVLVDFWRDPNKSTREDKTWVIEHLRADKDVFVEEIRSEGFDVVAEPEIEGLIENYVVIFKKAQWNELAVPHRGCACTLARMFLLGCPGEVGPGTGLLTRELSLRPGKKVYAPELSDGFIQHLKTDPRIDNNKVEIIGCTEEDLCLPAETDGSVDLAVLCDVYHHLTYPKTIIQQLRKALKVGNSNLEENDGDEPVVEAVFLDTGRLVLVDFWRDPKQKRFGAVGFDVVAEPEIEGLTEKYVVIFNKSSDEFS